MNLFLNSGRGLRGPAAREAQGLRAQLARGMILVSVGALAFPAPAHAQLSYVARFSLEKGTFIAGEPVFCDFIIQNTGTQALALSYRFPTRVLNRELDQEPLFKVRTAAGVPVADPAPEPCGGAKGSVVYGTVTLPPGRKHTERWLLNQWARASSPGRYRVRAQRNLPLFALDAAAPNGAPRPAARAKVADELTFEVMPSSGAQLRAVFDPYSEALHAGTGLDRTEAELVITTLPQPFLLSELLVMANAPAREQRWDRRQALEGLARLDTRPAWGAIAAIASRPTSHPPRPGQRPRLEDPSRSYAILLLGEKADPAFLPALLQVVSTGPEELRADALRALGFFHDLRANQVLFERLHSNSPSDRVSAILGLKNLESKEAVPALMAMLSDPEAKVRQVADFALESLTGLKIRLSPNASRAEAALIRERWHTWWRQNEANFVPVRQPACHDW